MQKNFILKYGFFVLILISLFSCNKTNWRENYRDKEKSPFGTYIIKNEVINLFPGEELITLKQNIYDYLFENYTVTDDYFGTYLAIKSNSYKISKDGVTDLLSFVAYGNTAFLSFNYLTEDLKEALEITTNNLDKNVYSISDLRDLEGSFYLKDAQFLNETYHFDRNIKRNYIVTYNEDKTVVLGTHKIDAEELPNFVKIYHGKGFVFVHTNPVVFTNYYMLKEKNDYVEHVFSYLPSSTLLWDPHIKNSKYSNNNKEDSRSVFSFFLEHETLTWFLWTAFAGLLLFLLFNAKRKQRAIPIIPAPENTTVAFTQTIASLYLKEEDHKNLADKKITYFLEKVRVKYLLKTNNLNKEFIEKLALKSGNDFNKTKYLVNTIITLNKRSLCSQEELVVLHKMIDNFLKNNTDGNNK